MVKPNGFKLLQRSDVTLYVILTQWVITKFLINLYENCLHNYRDYHPNRARLLRFKFTFYELYDYHQRRTVGYYKRWRDHYAYKDHSASLKQSWRQADV